MHSSYTFQKFMHSLGIEPMSLAVASACWAPGILSCSKVCFGGLWSCVELCVVSGSSARALERVCVWVPALLQECCGILLEQTTHTCWSCETTAQSNTAAAPHHPSTALLSSDPTITDRLTPTHLSPQTSSSTSTTLLLHFSILRITDASHFIAVKWLKCLINYMMWQLINRKVIAHQFGLRHYTPKDHFKSLLW